MVTPAQKEKDGKAAYKWRRLVTAIGLTEDAEWSTITNAWLDTAEENERLRGRIAMMERELAEARAGVMEVAF